MDVRDCKLIRYKNEFIHLRSSKKRVTARFATQNPANWHENQIEIRSKTLLIQGPWLIPQTLRTREEHSKQCCNLYVTFGLNDRHILIQYPSW